MKQRSRSLAFALAFIFGPIGLLYCAPLTAVFMFVLAVVATLTGPFALILLPCVWLGCIFLSLILV